jgi:predicted porin
MKKSLIALASLAVVTAASAQSNVTLYGIADVVIHKDSGSSLTMTSGGVSTSRWGLKGSEDLGGGLSANFNFEQSVDLTNGTTGTGFDRQAWVGFSGGFGEVKLGKAWNAYDDFAYAANSAFDANVLSPAVIAPSYTYVANPNKGVYYATPDFGGFGAAISSSFKDGADNQRVTAFHLRYETGPLFVAVGQERDRTDSGTRTATRLVGSYDFGVATLRAGFGNVKDEGKDYSIGADVPLSDALSVSGGLVFVRPDAGSNQNALGVAVNYALSKRTSVYTGFRRLNNAAEAATGEPKSRFGVGVKHEF